MAYCVRQSGRDLGLREVSQHLSHIEFTQLPATELLPEPVEGLAKAEASLRKSFHCPTVRLSHCLTVSLSDCLTV